MTHELLTMPYIKRQFGFTLIEVLVTMVILAIGLLGLAGLQLSALKNNTTAYERSQATILAYEIIDRMRANGTTVAGYATALGTAPQSLVVNCQKNTANCTPAQLAQFDVNQWKCSLGAWDGHKDCVGPSTIRLTGGDGGVVLNADGTVTVTIRWEEDRDGNTTSISVTTVI